MALTLNDVDLEQQAAGKWWSFVNEWPHVHGWCAAAHRADLVAAVTGVTHAWWPSVSPPHGHGHTVEYYANTQDGPTLDLSGGPAVPEGQRPGHSGSLLMHGFTHRLPLYAGGYRYQLVDGSTLYKAQWVSMRWGMLADGYDRFSFWFDGTAQEAAPPTCSRLYLTDDAPGDDPGGAGSPTAPNPLAFDAAWNNAINSPVRLMLWTTDDPAGGGGDLSSIRAGAITGVNTAYAQYFYLLSGAGTLSGHVRGQLRAKAAAGIGVSEAAQHMQSQMVVRVVAPNSTVRGTALAAHNPGAIDSTEWVPGTHINRKFPASNAWDDPTLGAALTPVAYQDGDFIVVEVGARNFTAAAEQSGGTLRHKNNAASDLPDDESTTTDLNSWIELCD